MTIRSSETRTPAVARGKAVELARRMLKLVETKTTDQAEEVFELQVDEYLDPTRFQAEVEVLFRKNPVFAGLSVELPEAGSYKTLDIPGFPLIVVRAEDGSLQAFLNSCRHRGSSLVRGEGRTHLFVCPYHGWSYDLAGNLRKVRSAEVFGRFNADCRSLIQVPVAERYGLIFVRATPIAEDPRPVDVEKVLSGLGAQMEEWRLDLTEVCRSTGINVAANWKLAVNTYLETYHFAVLHPKTVAKTHYSDHTTFDTYGHHQLAGFTGNTIGALASVPEDEWEPLRHLQFIYFLFPNTVLTVMRDHMEYFQTLPGRSAREAKTNYVYFTYPNTQFSSKELASNRFEREHSILIEEDCPMAETMQANIEGGALKSFLFGRNEPGLQHFHRSCRKMLVASGK